MPSLADPLARALLTAEWGAPLEEGDLDGSLDEALDRREEWWETPRQLAAATLGWLRADPETLAALAEALPDPMWVVEHDEDGLTLGAFDRERYAAALADALFGAP